MGNLFTRHLSLEVCCLVWDSYLVGGTEEEGILIVVSLIMLEWLEPHLYGRLDEALNYLGQPNSLPLDQLKARLPVPLTRPSPLPKLVRVINPTNNSSAEERLAPLQLPKPAVEAIKSLRLALLGP